MTCERYQVPVFEQEALLHGGDGDLHLLRYERLFSTLISEG